MSPHMPAVIEEFLNLSIHGSFVYMSLRLAIVSTPFTQHLSFEHDGLHSVFSTGSGATFTPILMNSSLSSSRSSRVSSLYSVVVIFLDSPKYSMHSFARVLSGPTGVDIFPPLVLVSSREWTNPGELSPLSPAKADDLRPRVSGT